MGIHSAFLPIEEYPTVGDAEKAFREECPELCDTGTYTIRPHELHHVEGESPAINPPPAPVELPRGGFPPPDFFDQ